MSENINDTCDYVIAKVAESGHYLNVLKLHKLLYYCQAWGLAFGGGRLFDERFQAWIHGPVSRTIYDRFIKSRALYSPVSEKDIRAGFDMSVLKRKQRMLVDAVLEKYAGLSGDQLEEMTHREEPWLEARRGVPSTERSENLISEKTMAKYYGARLKKN